MSFLVTRRAGGLLVLGMIIGAIRRLVTRAERNASDRTRGGNRRDLALALAGAFASAARSSSAARSPVTSSRPASPWASGSVSPAASCSGCWAGCGARCCRPRRAPRGLRARARHLRGRVDLLLHGPRARHRGRGRAHLLRVPGGRRARRDRDRAPSGCGPGTLLALVLAISGSAIVAIGGGQVAIIDSRACCFVCGSVVMFSAYVAPERPGPPAHRLPHRGGVDGDRRRRSASTAFGAARGRLDDAVGRRARGTRRQRGRDRGRVHAVLRRARPASVRPAPGSAWRSKRSPAIVLAAIFLGESVRPVVALGRCRGARGCGDRGAGVARSGRGARAFVAAVTARRCLRLVLRREALRWMKTAVMRSTVRIWRNAFTPSTMQDFPLSIAAILRHGQSVYARQRMRHVDRCGRSARDLRGGRRQRGPARQRPRRPRRRERRSRRHVLLEQPGAPRGVPRGPVDGRGAAHAQHPAVPRAARLRHQSRGGPSRSSSTTRSFRCSPRSWASCRPSSTSS